MAYTEPIVVRLKYAMRGYDVGAEVGFATLEDAIATFSTAAAFDVIRTQDGDPLLEPTPEEIAAAEAAAVAKLRAQRVVRGKEFDDYTEGWTTVSEAVDAYFGATTLMVVDGGTP